MTSPSQRRDGLRRHLPAVLMTIALAADIAAVGLIAAMIRAGSQPTLDLYTVGGMVVGATYAIVGWIIASRRSDNPIGWIFLTIGLSQAIDVFATIYATFGLVVAPGSLPLAAEWSWVAVWAWAPGFTLLISLSVLLFPDGRPPSPRWRPVVWASYAMLALLTIPLAIATWPYRGPALLEDLSISLGDLVGPASTFQTVGILLSPFVAAASIAGMVVRFRRAGAIERQQLKWFTWAAIPEVALIVSSGFLTIPPDLVIVASFVIAPLLPVAAAIAILRYHLFEIDRIVSRTIAYAAVTGLLVATYAGLILLIQGPLSDVTGGDTIAVALSTLVVAALFQPVRSRVQQAVDRRFHRARFDAEQTASAFSERLRDEVDLPTLTGELDTTVRRAIAPSSVALWLRGDHR